MNYSLIVCGGQAIHQLHRQLDGFARRHSGRRNALAQSLAFQQFGNDEMNAIHIAHIVNRNDIGMVQGSHRPRFLLESAQTVGIGSDRDRQHLDRNIAQQTSVACTVDFAHSASTDERNYFVGSELSFRSEGHGTAELYAKRFGFSWQALCATATALAQGKTKRNSSPLSATAEGSFTGNAPVQRFQV